MDGRWWVPRLRSKDPEAYEELFRTWYPLAYRTAYLITQDRQLAEDAVQEAFCRVLRSVDGLRDPDRLQGWLHVVVSRTAMDELRRRRTSPGTPVEDVEETLATEGGAALAQHGPPTPEAVALARARATAVMSALGSLPPSARQVVVLHYYHGLSVAEIAAALGCAEGTVKSRLWRARARLAEALREERGAADA